MDDFDRKAMNEMWTNERDRWFILHAIYPGSLSLSAEGRAERDRRAAALRNA